jgi:hypothetical protein
LRAQAVPKLITATVISEPKRRIEMIAGKQGLEV